jgi:hypothetical protein
MHRRPHVDDLRAASESLPTMTCTLPRTGAMAVHYPRPHRAARQDATPYVGPSCSWRYHSLVYLARGREGADRGISPTSGCSHRASENWYLRPRPTVRYRLAPFALSGFGNMWMLRWELSSACRMKRMR